MVTIIQRIVRKVLRTNQKVFSRTLIADWLIVGDVNLVEFEKIRIFCSKGMHFYCFHFPSIYDEEVY